MKIYNEFFFFEQLKEEIKKSEKNDYRFAVLAIKDLNPEMHSIALFNSILEAQLRENDLVIKKDNIYCIVLKNTTEENAQKYLARLIQKAVSENEIPIVAAITSVQDEDTPEKIMDRLMKKIV